MPNAQYTPNELRWLASVTGGLGPGEIRGSYLTDAQMQTPYYQSMLGKGAFTVGDPYQVELGGASNEGGQMPTYSEKRTPITSLNANVPLMPKFNGLWAQFAPGANGEYDQYAIGGNVGQSQIYNDPNYGAMYLAKPDKPDPVMQIAKGLAFAAAGYPIGAALGPALGSALGLGQGGAGIAGSAIKAIPGLISSGGRNFGSLLGSIFGGMSGVPFGSTLGGMAGGFVQNGLGGGYSPQPQQLQLTPQQQMYLAQLLYGRRG